MLGRVLGSSGLGCALTFMGCMDAATEHRTRANAYLRGNDALAAVRECEDGLAKRPNDEALLILRGKALFELERLDESKVSYQQALEAGRDKDQRSLSEAY